jgi:carbamoyltransferase
MNIVGINISHDVSVCLLQDGEILFYLEEERLSKKKYHWISDNELSYSIKTLQKIKKYVNHIDYLIISTSGRWPNWEIDHIISEKIVNDLLKIGIAVDKVDLNLENHHLHHAYNAFYFSGLESAVALVTDGSGSYVKDLHSREIESIYEFKNNKCETLYKHYSSFEMLDTLEKFRYKTLNDKIVISNTFGCAKLFELVCYFVLSVQAHEAGKAMGMSSYGLLSKKQTEWFHNYGNHFLFDCDFLCKATKSKIYLSATFKEKVDFAKKLQHETKEYTIRLIQKAIDLSKSNNVVLSGGYFQNCVNNYAYLKAFPNINFYVDPICYDGGAAIGACLYVWHHVLGNSNTLQKFDNLYLGPA